MKFKIKTDIPIPDRPGGSKPGTYPFRAMKIGDSFDGPMKARTAAVNFSRRVPDFRFITRAISNGNVRVWRVASNGK